MYVPLLKASFKSATFFACPGNLNNPSSVKPNANTDKNMFLWGKIEFRQHG